MAAIDYIKPLQTQHLRGSGETRIENWECAAAHNVVVGGGYPDGDTDGGTKIAYIYDNYRATAVIVLKSGGWSPPFHGRMNSRVSLRTEPFEIGEAGERMDSRVFRESIVTLANIGATSALSREDLYWNGEDGLIVGDGAVATAPLPIPSLAEALKGGRIALHGQLVRLFAYIALSAEARKARGLAGGDLTVKALVNGKRLLLTVETDTIGVLVEQEIIVRPFLDDAAVEAQLLHDPEVLLSVDTGSLLRTLRASGRSVNYADAEFKRGEEQSAFTVLFAGATGLSVGRLATKNGRTPDTRDWPLVKVSQSETLGKTGKAWQVIDAGIIGALAHSLDTVTVGLTDCRGEQTRSSPPVLFWTDSGVRVAAAGAVLHEIAS